MDRIVDTPIHDVQTVIWTSVTEDNHLVSLWSTWYHIWPDGIVLEHILQDMRAKDLNSPFRSLLLVNGILAVESLVSDY